MMSLYEIGKGQPEVIERFEGLLDVDDIEGAWNYLQEVTGTELQPMDSTSTLGQ